MAETVSMFAEDVKQGLSSFQKQIPGKWYYDKRGSELFKKITDLPDYYLTRCETEILQAHAEYIPGMMQGKFRLVDLGVGDGRKTTILLEHFVRAGVDFEFVAVDICREAVEPFIEKVKRQFPSVESYGIADEYISALRQLTLQKSLPTLLLFLGSNIGNFDEGGDEYLLEQFHKVLSPNDVVLIGFDLVKDPAVLLAAYSDTVVAEFNLNVLDRINRELRANIDRRKFRHEARWNNELFRMENWLVSRVPQDVYIPAIDRRFYFEMGEGIHVECSIKYTEQQIARLASKTGFTNENMMYDRDHYFCDASFRRH